MLAPWADALCLGAASIGLFLLWAALDLDLTSSNTLRKLVFLNFLINAPHFMASYKLLYGSAEMRRQYPGVAWWTPVVLGLWSTIGLVVFRDHHIVMEALFGAAVVSLSWHYTGQVWGMMASFAYIHGLGFARRERLLVRTNLWAVTAFHIVWAVIIVRKIFEPRGAWGGTPLLSAAQGTDLYRFVAVAALASSLLGFTALVLFARRTGRIPPARVWIPWISVHLWYVLLYREPAALFWVQNAHALQYLMFPMRAELNRREFGAQWAAADAGSAGGAAVAPGPAPGRAWWMLRWYVLVAIAGVMVFAGLPWVARSLAGGFGLAHLPWELTIISFVNLHHYFIDGVIWKIRNPKVRRDLFAHLSVAPPPGAGPAPARVASA
jgi:hypothetical protein